MVFTIVYYDEWAKNALAIKQAKHKDIIDIFQFKVVQTMGWLSAIVRISSSGPNKGRRGHWTVN